MTTPTVDTELHDVAWAAARLKRSEDSVRRMANRGDLPHRRDGRRLRFTETDIQQYVDSIAVPARSMGRSRPKTRRRAA